MEGGKWSRLEEMGIKGRRQKKLMCNGKKGAQVGAAYAGKVMNKSHGEGRSERGTEPSLCSWPLSSLVSCQM